MSAPPRELPLLCPRGSLLFPGASVSLEFADPHNLWALGQAPGLLAVAALRERGAARTPENFAGIVTLAREEKRVLLPRGGLRVTLTGLERAVLEGCERRGGGWLASVSELRAPEVDDATWEEAREFVLRRVAELASRGGLALPEEYDPEDLPHLLRLNGTTPEALVDFAATVLHFPYTDTVSLYARADPMERVRALNELLEAELVQAETVHSLDVKVRDRLRRNYLREQLEVLREELGEESPKRREAREFEERIAAARLPETAHTFVTRELELFRRASRGSVAAGAARNWLSWVLDLPWASHHARHAATDFEQVRKTLESSHIGLSEVKERVAEFLAVRQLRRSGRGTALCFLGPPGVGKSSMARTVAKALGREFVHISLGGITDESDLRGASFKQADARPGVILEGIHRAGTCNPVILLDEIDKLVRGGSGTASGALLEILDPDHNAEFIDDYVGVPFDLSRCIFLTTATDADELTETLYDRLEIVDFYGYAESEKVEIARKHLLPGAREKSGLEKRQLTVSPAALTAIVRNYTEESGVRHLRRVLESLARKAAVDVVSGGPGLSVRKGELLELLGPSIAEEHTRSRVPTVGVTAGLAWTSAGGTLLPIEALAMPGSGNTILTGQVGDVMRESVQTAISYVRTLFADLGIQQDALDNLDLHLHFPSGAVPKDGPSAGIAICIAVFSLLTGTPARHDIAMTGELSLLGNVLPVGGLRDKLLAAIRGGMTDVIVPFRNEEEVLRLPSEIRNKLTIHLIGHVQEAFGLTLSLDRRRRRDAPSFLVGEKPSAARRAREKRAKPSAPDSLP